MVPQRDINYQHFFPIWRIARQNVYTHDTSTSNGLPLSLTLFYFQPILCCPVGVFQLLLQAQVLRL